jgi:UDP-N-acetylmuramyl pentapeptide phosphotransferase/UDP-N-acetylglucosamine-1-phosphate transferase/glycosyltransferase involved in cell wall biosynthesis
MAGLIYFASAALAAAVAVLMTPVACAAGHRWGLLDYPDPRKVHRKPTPRVGGLGFTAAWWLVCPAALGLAALAGVLPGDVPMGAWLVLGLATAGIYLVGLADDILDLPAALKLLAIALAAASLPAAGLMIDILPLERAMGPRVDTAAAWCVTILFIVGTAVAMNFIDGLDGLAAGVAAIAALALGVVCGLGGLVAPAIFSLALAGSLAGFLVFNKHPAKVFMGDGGSMFIGFTLAGCGVAAAAAGDPLAGVGVLSIALAVPILDAALVFVRRGVLQRRSLLAAGWGHIHHHLIEAGLSHPAAVRRLYWMTAACSLLAIGFWLAPAWGRFVVLAAALLLLVVMFRRARSLHGRKYLAAFARNRQRSKAATRYRRALHDAQLRFMRARSFDQWWHALCEAAGDLDIVRLNLAVDRRDGSFHQLSWQNTNGHSTCSRGLSTFVPIQQRRGAEPLQAEVLIGSDDSLEGAGHRLSLFTRLIDEFHLGALVGHADKRRTPQIAKPASSTPPRTPDARPQRPASPDGPWPIDPPPAANPAKPRRRIAIVHDFLYTYGGAERVLEQMLEVYPEADVFSLFDFVPEDQRGFLKGKTVTTSFIQRMPKAARFHRHYLPLMPLAVEQLDVSGYDIVLSSSYLAAKGVITRPDQLHVCYCHSPVRFAWDLQHQYLGEQGITRGLKSWVVRCLLQYMRNFDTRSSNGVDHFLANSNFIARRIKKFYRREAETIYPPVDLQRFQPVDTPREDFYLVASRLVPYKKVELIVQAFNRMPERKLVVVGTGPQEQRVRDAANDNVEVMGFQSSEKLVELMQACKAFVFAAEEDFGIVPVEAQACGTPVIAFGRGGATETVIDRVTGVLFHEQTPLSIMDAVLRFEQMNLDPKQIRRNAQRFSPERFRTQLQSFVDQRAEQFRAYCDADSPQLPQEDEVDGWVPPHRLKSETKLGYTGKPQPVDAG